MLQLFLDSTKVQDGGLIKLRWCIPSAIRDELKGREAYVLIVVQPQGKPNHLRYQVRQLVQLNAGATFISFRYAGDNKVFARILIGERRLLESFLRGSDDYLNADGTDWLNTTESITAKIAPMEVRVKQIDAMLSDTASAPTDGRLNILTQERDQLRNLIGMEKDGLQRIKREEQMRGITPTLNVPTEAFGKEWPKWLNTYMSFLSWGGKPLDECNRMHRLLWVGIPVQPFLMAGSFLVRLVGAVVLGLVVGVRRINYAAVFRLVKYGFPDVFRGLSTPFWLHDSEAEKKESPWRILLAPLCPLFILIMSLFLRRMHPEYFAGEFLYLVVAAIAVGYAIMAGFMAILALVMLILMPNWDEVAHFLNPLRWLGMFLSGGSAKVDDGDLDRLVCTGDCLPEDRKERPTLRLWILRKKASSCRPLQG